MGWCNYIVDKKNRLAFSIGKMTREDFVERVIHINELVDTIKNVSDSITEEDTDLLNSMPAALSLDELYRLIMCYKAVRKFSYEPVYPQDLVAACYYTGQSLASNPMEFLTEDDYEKECKSGLRFTVIGN